MPDGALRAFPRLSAPFRGFPRVKNFFSRISQPPPVDPSQNGPDRTNPNQIEPKNIRDTRLDSFVRDAGANPQFSGAFRSFQFFWSKGFLMILPPMILPAPGSPLI